MLDPFAAYQETAKVISAKKGSARRGSASGTTSRDEVVLTSSRQVVTVKMEPPSLAQTKKPKSGGMDPIVAAVGRGYAIRGEPCHGLIQFESAGISSGRHCPSAGRAIGSSSHPSMGASPVASQAELVDLKRQASEEGAQRLAREMEIHDLKDKVKDPERTAEVSLADALAIGKRNSELEEAMGTLKLEMVMGVNGARVIARWELMREWLKGQSNQWDLVKALEQYKAITLEEAKNKIAPLPTFEDEPAIPSVSRMDVDRRPGGSSS
ncbi:hypothetical protein DY000_02039468 [Brassica cretica]|uniref:Uncharacterized protein n=1 Tax=Brassica cretica TaxID=69181 RepID=A0ABQ7B8V8_BRACR|nr:hypothetical protein DY000_02039468 [Brassica cretica]